MDRISDAEERVCRIQYKIVEIQSHIYRAGSFLFSITSFFTKETIDVPALELTITNLNRQIEAQKHTLANSKTHLKGIYDYWPTYPPDWDERKYHAKESVTGCSNPDCKLRVRKRHVHHITPVSLGGSHRADNLMVLCIKCHKRAHGVKEFPYDSQGISFKPENQTKKAVRLLPTRRTRTKQGTTHCRHDNYGECRTLSSGSSRTFGQRVANAEGKSESKPESLIERRNQQTKSAMRSNQLLHFKYTKPDGNKSVRTIRPEQIKNVEATLCVSGYCYLRNASRTFAFKRMRHVAVVREVQRCMDL